MKICDLDEIKIGVNRQYENCHGYSGNKKQYIVKQSSP